MLGYKIKTPDGNYYTFRKKLAHELKDRLGGKIIKCKLEIRDGQIRKLKY